MRLQIERQDSTSSVAVSIDDDAATVADLAGALYLDETAALNVDGAVHLPDTPLSDVALVDGSVVSSLGVPSNRRAGLGNLWVGIDGGPGAGAVRNLDAVSNIVIGRSEFAELNIDNPNVSNTHAAVESEGENSHTIVDLESTNGTWVEGNAISKPTKVDTDVNVRVGSSSLTLRSVQSNDRPIGISANHADDRGKTLFNRPPRTPLPDGPAVIELPDAPVERAGPVLAVVSFVAPLLFALVMVQVLGRWQYALFGLMSPVMAVGNWVSARRRVKREREGDVKTQREAMSTLKRQLGDAIKAERSRRALYGPDLLEIRRRIEVPSTRLWERRLGDADAVHVRIGVGSINFEPATTSGRDVPPTDVMDLVASYSDVDNIELLADLRTGPLGIVGQESYRNGAARSLLLQLATHHGPADFQIAILTTAERLDQWEWAHWLPHTRTPSESSVILAGDAAGSFASGIVEQLEDAGGGFSSSQPTALRPGWLIVVDDVTLLHRRSSAVRNLLERSSANLFGIVLTDTADQLPAATTSVANIESLDGEVELSFPQTPGKVDRGIVDLVAVDVASDLARQMARFEDPELPMPNGDVPRMAKADDVLGPGLTPEAIEQRWTLSMRSDALNCPLGLGEQGLVSIDMVGDGPHALVGGTTGAGKSELLRTMILGLAANYDPDDLVFVLVDYKGGSAFDACADLPHVVGLVTDLDAHLSERALRSLEAELHHRESVLRSVAAKDIADYRSEGSPKGALPRLVVIIDEFATLRTELPDFMTALIGIAQRGRSLGVHLVLATQRPTGAVDANIKANTNLRIALRMQDGPDSMDVIDDKRAAELSRSAPGRAYIRTGQGELTIVQSGFLSGPTGSGAAAVRAADVPIGSGLGPQFPSVVADGDTTELQFIVDTIGKTPRRGPTPRRPWLLPLPKVVAPEDLAGVMVDSDDGTATEPRVRLALGDEPDKQRRLIRSWRLTDGGLVVLGVLGSGVSTALRSVIAALGKTSDERPVWVFPVDHSAGGLTGIDKYPHVSPVIAATDTARHARLFSVLSEALETRREMARAEVERLPLMVVVVDGAASFAETNDLAHGSPTSEVWGRIVRDGPSVGIVTILGATRRNEVPRSTWAAANERIFFEQSDPTDFSEIGVRAKDLPTFAPGLALWGSDAMVVQMIDWESLIDPETCTVSQELPDISPLAPSFERKILEGVVAEVEPNIVVPIGIDDATRRVTQLSIRAGEHALVAGPSGSGRTTALQTIAHQLRLANSDLILVGVAPTAEAELFSAGVFDGYGTVEGLDDVLIAASTEDRRWVIIIDDADRIDIEKGPLLDLAKSAPPNVTLIAAGRSATLRQAYGHWTRFVRASGSGILLQPDPTTDGDLLSARLPRDGRLPELPGRGYLVGSGEAHVIQICH